MRANLDRYTDKPEQALARARSAAETFLWFGDRRRWLDACDFEAATHYARNDYKRALEVWESMREYLDLREPAGRAAVLHNIALCRRETGSIEPAVEAFRDAAALFAASGMHVSHTSAVCNLGVALMLTGRYHEALPLIRSAWREFQTLGMKPEATLAALRLVEGLMIMNRGSEVAAICRDLVDWCTHAGMTKSAMTAIAFLRERVATGLAKPEHVREIHGFLHETHVREGLFAAD